MYKIQERLKKDDDIYDLYMKLDWIKHVHKNKDELIQIMNGSHYVIYVYDKNELIGTGRMVSDGFLTSLICGVGVAPDYQGQGIGKQIIENLVAYGQSNGLFVELTCNEKLEGYYNQLNFKKYGIAMK